MLYSLDHAARLQTLQEGRVFHLRLPRDHVGLLHSGRHCENPNLQAHFSLLGLGQLIGRLVSQPVGHYHG